MGIYYDNIIYGVSWEIFNNDDKEQYNIIKKFEKSYKEKMNLKNIQEIKTEYDKITDIEKININFYVLLNCSTTYEIDICNSYVSWYSFEKKSLENFFINGYVKL